MKVEEGHEVYDPIAGSGGLLIRARETLRSRNQNPESLALFGQELNPQTAQLGKLILALNGVNPEVLIRSNAFENPLLDSFDELRKFDRVIANPPFSIKRWSDSDAARDRFDRFRFGIPPRSNGDFAFIQHMIASLKPDGVMGTVVTSGLLFRGGAERSIRKNIIKEDLIEAVIALPAKMFSHSGIATAVLIINKNKPHERKNKILFINADRDFEKGRARNSLNHRHTEKIVEAYEHYRGEEQFSKVVGLNEVSDNSFNLNVSRYVDSSELKSLLLQHYGTFERCKLGDLELEKDSIRSVGKKGKFDCISNSLYIPRLIRRSTPSIQLSELNSKNEDYFQVVLNPKKAVNGYVSQFLGSSVGQAALESVANSSTLPTLSKEALRECTIALPKLAEQQENC